MGSGSDQVELEESEQRIFTWRGQARIGAGLEAGATTGEPTSHAIDGADLDFEEDR